MTRAAQRMGTTDAEYCLSVQISLVIIFIVAVIIYRVLVSIPLFQNSTFRSQAQAIANMTGAVVNLILIMAMSRVYEKLAHRLTAWGESPWQMHGEIMVQIVTT